ncbi:MAG: dockerin type I repeat-containing protein [Ruminococcus sp.]|nr:dockerin type I repeat-containing protein [Ruminococcus sp.]
MLSEYRKCQQVYKKGDLFMNKKLKRMIATVSAIALCAVSAVSTGAGAIAVNFKGEKYPNQYTTSFYVAGRNKDIKYTFWQAGTDFYGKDGLRIFISEPKITVNSFTGEEEVNYDTMFVHTYMIGDNNGGKKPFSEVIPGYSINSFSEFVSYAGDVNEDKIPLIEEYLLKNSIPYTVDKIKTDYVDYVCIELDNSNMDYDEMTHLATKIRKAVDWSFEDMVFPTSDAVIKIKDIEIELPEPTLIGDANEDGVVNISDAVLIMQSISNPTEYQLSIQGMANADVVDNDGVTLLDALRIQEMSAGL